MSKVRTWNNNRTISLAMLLLSKVERISTEAVHLIDTAWVRTVLKEGCQQIGSIFLRVGW